MFYDDYNKYYLCIKKSRHMKRLKVNTHYQRKRYKKNFKNVQR